MVTGVLRLAEWVTQRPIPYLSPTLKTILIFVLFYIATFSVYNATHTEVETLREEVKALKAKTPALDLTRPWLRAEFGTVSVGEGYILLDMILFNQGAPSIAYGWEVSVTPKGQNNNIPLTIARVPEKALGATLELRGGNSPTLTIPLKDEIIRKAELLIQTGDYVRGFLMTNEIPRSTLSGPPDGATIHVICLDSHRNKYRFDYLFQETRRHTKPST